MRKHRTAAARRAPQPRRHVAGLCSVRLLRDGTHAFGLRLVRDGRRICVVLHERPDCACGCGGGWNVHLAHVELLRLRVQGWSPAKGGDLA